MAMVFLYFLIKQVSLSLSQPNTPAFSCKTIFIRPTNTVELCKIVNDLKEKVGGVDGINAKTIKIIAPYIVTPLQHIFNLSIVDKLGRFPTT